MKVLLLKDVYKLGRAGEVKKVADGYGRNFLLPQRLAVLATAGALKQAEGIRQKAAEQRTLLNQEMGAVADKLTGVVLTFPARASETGKLYGSITSQMVAESLTKKIGLEIARRQVDMQPLRTLGEFEIGVRLTVDLIPQIKVIVHREGEAVALPQAEKEPEVVEPVEAVEPAEVAELAEAVELAEVAEPTQAVEETPEA